MSQEEAPTEDVQEVVNRTPNESLVEQLPLGEGAVAGSGAFLLAYLFYHQVVTYATTLGNVSTDGPSGWIVAGWYFFGSHNVPVLAGGETAAISVLPNLGTSGVNVTSAWPLQVLMLFAPAILLVGAGYLVVSWHDPDDLVETVSAAATIAVPYLVLSLVAAFVMTHTYTAEGAISQIVNNVEPLFNQYAPDGATFGQAAVGPDNLPNNLDVGVGLTDAALFAGVVYPVVFGVIGGVIAKKELVVDEISAKLN